MKKHIVFCLIVLLSLSAGYAKQEKADIPLYAKRIRAELAAMEERYVEDLSHDGRKDVIRRMERIMRLLDKIESAYAGTPEEDHFENKISMSGDTFAAALKMLHDDYSFDKDRVMFVGRLASDHWFTTEQAAALMEEIKFDANKVPVFKSLYPKLVDGENAFKLLERFDFKSNRKKAEEMMEKQ